MLETFMLFRPRAIALLLLLFVPAVRVCAQETPGKNASPPRNDVVVKLVATSLDVPHNPGRAGGGMRRGPWNGGNGGNEANGSGAAGFVIVTPAEGGAPVKLVVADDVRRKLASLGRLRGELVKLSLRPGPAGEGELVSALAPFDGPRVLERRQAFIFDGVSRQKVNGQVAVVVKLSKFGQTREAQVPNHPAAEGGMPGPDGVVMERLKAFSAGDVVEVDLAGSAGNWLVDIDVAREPRVAEFVKTTSVKDVFDKSWPAVVLALEGREETFLLPAARPGMPVSASVTAMSALARRVVAGYAVRFTARPPEAEGRPAVLRTLTLDGAIEPRSDQRLELVSSYVRVEMWEDGRGRGVNVDYQPGSTRAEDLDLERGAARAVSSDAQISLLSLDPEKAKQISAVLDQLEHAAGAQPTTQERGAWTEAYQAWMEARDTTTRARVEGDLLWAGQDLSARWRKEYASRYTLIRSLLDSTQLEEVMRLGREAGAGRGRF